MLVYVVATNTTFKQTKIVRHIHAVFMFITHDFWGWDWGLLQYFGLHTAILSPLLISGCLTLRWGEGVMVLLCGTCVCTYCTCHTMLLFSFSYEVVDSSPDLDQGRNFFDVPYPPHSHLDPDVDFPEEKIPKNCHGIYIKIITYSRTVTRKRYSIVASKREFYIGEFYIGEFYIGDSTISVHVKHKIIHYCSNARDVTAGVDSSTMLVGIYIAF